MHTSTPLKRCLFTAALLATALLAGAATATAATTPVPVLNGNFDGAFTGSTPSNWTLLTAGGEAFNSFGGQTSPAGGAYWGIQSLAGWGTRFNAGGISQTLGNLTVGATYSLSFYSMANHTNSSQTEFWNVSFGDQTFAGATVDAANAGVWKQSTLSFTATSTSQLLKFAAVFVNTTPGVSPEILNLDGISMSMTAAPVPEPSTLAMLASGLACMAFMVRRRQPALSRG